MNKSLDPNGRYVIYLRKSRADRDAEMHGAEETLAHHKQILTGLAQRYNIAPTAIYKEIVSGETISARPEMQRLLTEVDAGEWDGVIVMEVERLARGDTVDQGIVAQSFKYSSTLIITPSKIYDPNDEFDEEYFEFGLFMSRREYKTITRRINRGRLASVKEGKYISPVAPYGYQIVKLQHEKGYTLAPDPERASAVQLIYDLYINGLNGEEYGSRKIALHLDAIGIKPMRKEHWSPASIRDILKNETYTGKTIWQKRREVKTMKDGNVIKMRPTAANYICAQGKHPALISENDYRKAQNIMHSHARTTSTTGMPLQNPLAGIVYCEKCGALMTRLAENSRNKYSTLKCPNTHCDNVSAPIFLIEEKLIAFLKEWLNGYSVTIISDQASQSDATIALLTTSIEEHNSELTILQGRLSKTYEFLETGIYTPDIFRERHSALQQEEKQLRDKICQLEKKRAREERKREEIDTLLPRSQAVGFGPLLQGCSDTR